MNANELYKFTNVSKVVVMKLHILINICKWTSFCLSCYLFVQSTRCSSHKLLGLANSSCKGEAAIIDEFHLCGVAPQSKKVNQLKLKIYELPLMKA